MEEINIKLELKKIKIKKRQLATKIDVYLNQDVSSFDSCMLENHLKSMDSVCFDLTDAIDELIVNLEDSDSDENISYLESLQKEIKQMLTDSKECVLKKQKHVVTVENPEPTLQKLDELKLEKVVNSGSTSAHSFGQKVEKNAIKKIVNSVGSEDPSEIVLSIVLDSIGQELGVKGTRAFLAASLTHYAISQFAVLVGLATSPIKMDFSGITQAKILKKLEDLDIKVDKIINAPRKEALSYLNDGLIELRQKEINFKEARDKFQHVRTKAKKAISMDDDFTHYAVCTKYLLFAETMVQAYTEGDENHDECFLPIEKLSEGRKSKMVDYLCRQVEELRKQAKTKGKKKEDHRNKIDDILKMIYNIISACKNLTNANTPIENSITFGIDTDYVPYEEDDATFIQVGRYTKGKKHLTNQGLSKTEIKETPAYIVYLWRTESSLFVRRELKSFEIPLGKINTNIIWVKLEELNQPLICQYGTKLPKETETFTMTAEKSTGYPENIQDMNTLFETARTAKDISSLPKQTYEQMGKISEVYLSDLGIDINEKDQKGNTILHYVAILKSSKTSSFSPIDCLVNAGADLSSQNLMGQTPLMTALLLGSGLEKNIKNLIRHCVGTKVLNLVDNDGGNVLHIAASLKESTFTKDIVQKFLDIKVDPTCSNKKGFNPKDWAHYHKNWEVKRILDKWVNAK